MFPHLQKMNPNLLTPQCKESFVLLSTPPFFQKGVSLTALQLWGPNPKNLILIPGKCIQGTVGNDLCNGKKAIYIDKQPIIIESTVMNISLSQHCDQNDLLQFINLLKPDSIMFIHGDLSASNTLKQILVKQSHYRPDHIYIPKDKETVVVNPLKLRYNCCSSVFQMEKDCYLLSDPIELSTTSEDSYSHKQKYTQDQVCFSFLRRISSILFLCIRHKWTMSIYLQPHLHSILKEWILCILQNNMFVPILPSLISKNISFWTLILRIVVKRHSYTITCTFMSMTSNPQSCMWSGITHNKKIIKRCLIS